MVLFSTWLLLLASDDGASLKQQNFGFYSRGCLNGLNFQPALGWISGHTSLEIETDSARNGEWLDEFSLPPCGWRRPLGVYWWLNGHADVLRYRAVLCGRTLRRMTASSAGGFPPAMRCPQPDRLTLGGGLAIRRPFGTFLRRISRPIRSMASGVERADFVAQ